jgi:hypothetical protein
MALAKWGATDEHSERLGLQYERALFDKSDLQKPHFKVRTIPVSSGLSLTLTHLLGRLL